MALVKCPECGRENVSDTASMCPGCGYDIKSHFATELQKAIPDPTLVRNQKELTQREAVKQQNVATSDLSDEARKKKNIQYLKNQIQEKKKEMAVSGGIAGVALCIFIAVIASGANVWLGFFSFGTALLSGIVFFTSYSDFESHNKDIHLINTNIEEYDKLSEQRIDEAKKALLALAKQEEIKHPQCPHCGSKNTQRISTMNRATSVAVVGLASSKIGKQYECKKCKHKW